MGGATSTVKVIDETTKDGVDIGCTPELPLKHGRDLSWSNVNFVVGEKSVLKDCWGEVQAQNFIFGIILSFFNIK